MKKYIRSIFKLAPLEKLLLYLNSGKEYGSLLTRITPNHTDYSSPSVRQVTRNGVKYSLDISNLVDWYIYFNFMNLAHELFLNSLKEDDTIIDVGANIGLISMRAALIAKNGTVYSFEPYGKTFDRLEYHKQLNGLENIYPCNMGLGRKEEEVAFNTNFVGNPGMYRINKNFDTKSNRIKIGTLDRFVAENNLQRIDAIKIDVEGYEMEVLLGATKTLSDFKPMLFVELDDNNLIEQGVSARELIEHLENFNYNIRHSITGEVISANSQLINTHFDIICT